MESCVGMSYCFDIFPENPGSADVICVRMTVEKMSDWDRSYVSDSIEHAMSDCGRAVNDNDSFSGYQKKCWW